VCGERVRRYDFGSGANEVDVNIDEFAWVFECNRSIPADGMNRHAATLELSAGTAVGYECSALRKRLAPCTVHGARWT
jgi:hypothetical protein